ncbi:hypothetical protein AB0E21_04440 [Streptomyces sp. NPDC047967]|uniref:hypothetical protein n=1 Tax=Streptomyces sp. NPDC047967 TaxID=3154924 RepID=UPI0033F112A5
MTTHRFALTARAVAAAALLLPAAVACGGQDTADDAPASAAPAVSQSADVPRESPGTSPTGASPSPAAFDPEAIPVSEVPWGEFPHLALPEGFENPEAEIPVVPSDSVPFWTGDRLEWVVGKVHQSPIYARDGRTFSRSELVAAVESAVTELGGLRVTDSRIPGAVIDTIPHDVSVDYVDGLGDIHNNPVQTYVVRGTDRLLWVHVCANSAGGSWMIAESMA